MERTQIGKVVNTFTCLIYFNLTYDVAIKNVFLKSMQVKKKPFR